MLRVGWAERSEAQQGMKYFIEEPGKGMRYFIEKLKKELLEQQNNFFNYFLQ